MQRPAHVFEPPNGQFLLLFDVGEAVAGGAFGYSRIYLATGYTPLFDVDADPLTMNHLAFEKLLG